MSGKAVAAAAAALLVVPALLLVVVVGTDSPPCGPGVAPSVAPTAPPAGNASLVAAATPLGAVVAPMRSGTFQVSSPFGARSDGSVHQGQDMAAPAGTDIYAATDGVVVASGPASGFGQWIVLDGVVGGQPVSTVYGHMFPEGVLVRAGARVSAGQVIAKVGNSGQG